MSISSKIKQHLPHEELSVKLWKDEKLKPAIREQLLEIADAFINFNKTFLIAMSHQIFLVSFGAFTILMYLIKNNSASKTVTIFFLIPATTAIIAWIFLNEQLSNLDIFGFVVASFGVYLATRKTS